MSDDDPLESQSDKPPYKGPLPYEEEDRDNFFGRDRDREVLVHKILAHKLTLLFAAAGAGKSSLLRAGVIPHIKDPRELNLDVVYCKEWVDAPLATLKARIKGSLEARGRLDAGAVPQGIEQSELKEFISFCALFARHTLVIVLDQFEEFFQYWRTSGSAEYTDFVRQLSAAILDQTTPCAFVISMREDCALELDELKELKPELYQNYYRLRYLELRDASKAIRMPVKRLGFRYEPLLFKALIKDLLIQQGDVSPINESKKPASPAVEPASLQIVCSELWQEERNNPEKKLRLNTYENMGRAKGILARYFNRVFNSMSRPRRKLASRAFDFLVTRRGTKIAYPADDLANNLKVDKEALSGVLNELHRKFILRRFKRLNKEGEKEFWYELYHDLFSDPIREWNVSFKDLMMCRRILINVAAVLGLIFILYLFYDLTVNRLQRELHLSTMAGIADTIELYQGKLDSQDLFRNKAYLEDTDFERGQVEASKLFAVKPVRKTSAFWEFLTEIGPPEQFKPFLWKGLQETLVRDGTYGEVLETLDPLQEVKARWEDGQMEKALDFARDRVRYIPKVPLLLAGFRSIKAAEVLKNSTEAKDFEPLKSAQQESIIRGLAAMPDPLAVDCLKGLMDHKDRQIRLTAVSATVGWLHSSAFQSIESILKSEKDLDLRKAAAAALGRLGDPRGADALLGVLKVVGDPDLSRVASEALQRLNCTPRGDSMTFHCRDAVSELPKILKGRGKDQLNTLLPVVAALGQLGDRTTIEPLKTFQKKIEKAAGGNWFLQMATLRALGQLSEQWKATDHVDFFIKRLKAAKSDPLRASLIEILGQLNNTDAVKKLTPFLDRKYDNWVRANAAEALGQLGEENAVKSLKDHLPNNSLPPIPDEIVRWQIAGALGRLGGPSAVEGLKQILFEDGNDFVRWRAAEALGRLGDQEVGKELMEKLKGADSTTRIYAVEALGRLGDSVAVDGLKDRSEKPKETLEGRYLDLALGRLGQQEAVDHLIDHLKDSDDTYIRWNSAMLLGSLGNVRALDGLVDRLLNDPEPLVRRSAAEALGHLGDCRAVEPLIERLDDPHVLVRRRAALSLGALGDERAIVPLKARLDDPHDFVRWGAMEALQELGKTLNVTDLSQGDPLKERMRNRFEYVRQTNPQAAWTQFSDPSFWEPPTRVYYAEREKRRLRDEARGITVTELERLANGKQLSEKMKAAEILGVDIAERRDEWRQLRVSGLSRLMGDKHVGVREQAIRSVGKARVWELLGGLVKLLEDGNDHNIRTQLAAAEALADLTQPHRPREWEEKSKDVLQAVAQRITDPTGTPVPVRLALLKVLANIGSEDAVEKIISAVNSDEESLGLRAYTLLGELCAGTPPEDARHRKVMEHLRNRLAFLTEEHWKWIEQRDGRPPVSEASGQAGIHRKVMEYLRNRLAFLTEQHWKWIEQRDGRPPVSEASGQAGISTKESADRSSARPDPIKRATEERENRQKPLEDWQKKQKPWVFVVAYNMARIDPRNAGLELLGDRLADVRKGAWHGLGRVGDVNLIATLRERYSDAAHYPPRLRHAAYRAIDHILMRLEVIGDASTLKELKELFTEAREDPAVETRAAWTIKTIKGRMQQNSDEGGAHGQPEAASSSTHR